MVAGKTQLAAAAVAVAFAGSAFAMPTAELLFARNPKVKGEAASKAIKTLGGEGLQNKGKEIGNNVLNRFKAQPAPLPQPYHDAINRMNGPHPQPLVQAATTGHLKGKGDIKKRSFNDEVYELYARNHGPKSASASRHAVPQAGQEKRDLHDAMRVIAREFGNDAVYELVARSGIIRGGGRVIGDLLQNSGTGLLDKTIKDKFGPKPKPIDASTHDAISKMTGPHDPTIVAAAVHPKPNSGDNKQKKKRDLAEEIYEIFARELELDDLE